MLTSKKGSIDIRPAAAEVRSVSLSLRSSVLVRKTVLRRSRCFPCEVLTLLVCRVTPLSTMTEPLIMTFIFNVKLFRSNMPRERLNSFTSISVTRAVTGTVSMTTKARCRELRNTSIITLVRAVLARFVMVMPRTEP